MHPRCTPGCLDFWGESSYLGRATCGIWWPGGAEGREADTDRHPRSLRPPSSSAGSPVLSPHAPQTPQRGKIPVSSRGSEFASLRRFRSFRNSLLPCRQSGKETKNRAETERTWAPAAPPCFPDFHRSPLRCHFSLNSPGTVRKIGVSCRGRGGSSSPVLTVQPHGDSGQRPCVPAPRNYSFSFGMVRAGINTFECFLHLSAYSLLSTSNPPLFLCACVSSQWIFRDHLGRWAAKSAYYPSMDSLPAAEINSLIDFCEQPWLPSANKLDGLNVSH